MVEVTRSKSNEEHITRVESQLQEYMAVTNEKIEKNNSKIDELGDRMEKMFERFFNQRGATTESPNTSHEGVLGPLPHMGDGGDRPRAREVQDLISHRNPDQSGCSTNVFFSARRGVKPSSSGRSLSIQAIYRDGGRSSNGGFFVGGFVLGGLIVGALGCVYAPQISKAISGTDKEEIMKKLPKFIYDEEKALEKQRKILAKKIEQINSSIDGISAQLRSEDTEDGAPVNPDEIEALI